MVKSKKPVFDDAGDAHNKCVANDSDFTIPAKAIRDELGVNESFVIGLAKKDGKTTIGLGDINSYRTLPDSILQRIKQMAEDFALEVDDVIHYINFGNFPTTWNKNVSITFDRSPNLPQRAHHGLGYSPNGLTITIGPNATKTDISKLINELDEAMEYYHGTRIKKNKPPQNFQLVYAVFRARTRNLKFSEIFRLYQDGKLPNYNGSKGLSSVEKLKQYYYKYRVKSTT